MSKKEKKMTRREFCIAAVAATAAAKVLAAEYSLASDDLYVRARVESDAPAPYYVHGGKGAMHPKVAMAWTQPYQGQLKV